MLKHEELQMEFMTYYDSIVNLARAAFFPVRESDKDELVAEVLAKSWKVFLKYHGKCEMNASFIAYFPIEQTRAKIHFNGENTTDVLSPRAKHVGKVDTAIVGDFSPYTEARSVKEDPAEYVRVKIDFNEFASGLTLNQRKVYHLMVKGYRPGEIARKLGITRVAVYNRRKSIRRKLREKVAEYAAA